MLKKNGQVSFMDPELFTNHKYSHHNILTNKKYYKIFYIDHQHGNKFTDYLMMASLIFYKSCFYLITLS